MISENKLIELGRQKCIDLLGYEYCRKNADNGLFSHGYTSEGRMSCFMGIDSDIDNTDFKIGGRTPFEIYASVEVDPRDGKTTISECRRCKNE